MVRPQNANAALDLEAQIDRLAQQLKTRIDMLGAELGRLSAQYERLTGRAALNGDRRGSGSPVVSFKPGRVGRRIRRQGVDVAWITGRLKSKPMTLRQLQQVAESERRSSLSVMNVLRANQGKFKSSQGTKEAGVRGRAAQVWSVK